MIPKGIKTSLNAAKDYLNVVNEIIKNNFMDLFLNHIVVPMGPTPIDMLKYMRDEECIDDDQTCLEQIES